MGIASADHYGTGADTQMAKYVWVRALGDDTTRQIYITHDLSTAYCVSDYIATLYRGGLIEYGPAKELMDNPAHPYTELLMNAVPRVGDKWKENLAMPDMEGKEFALTCCKFAPRCPYATDQCRKERPDETDLGNERMVRCFHALVKP